MVLELVRIGRVRIPNRSKSILFPYVLVIRLVSGVTCIASTVAQIFSNAPTLARAEV